MAIIEITEFKRYGYTVFLNADREWEIKELKLAFKTSQQAELYLRQQNESK